MPNDLGRVVPVLVRCFSSTSVNALSYRTPAVAVIAAATAAATIAKKIPYHFSFVKGGRDLIIIPGNISEFIMWPFDQLEQPKSMDSVIMEYELYA